MPPKRKLSITKSISDQEDDEAYRKKRERNNEAVKKSRDKKKKTTELTHQKVENMKEENTKLKERIATEKKNLEMLKDLFLKQAESKVSLLTNDKIKEIMRCDPDDDDDGGTSSTSK